MNRRRGLIAVSKVRIKTQPETVNLIFTFGVRAAKVTCEAKSHSTRTQINYTLYRWRFEITIYRGGVDRPLLPRTNFEALILLLGSIFPPANHRLLVSVPPYRGYGMDIYPLKPYDARYRSRRTSTAVSYFVSLSNLEKK